MGRILPGLPRHWCHQHAARPHRYAHRHWAGFSWSRRAEPGARAHQRRKDDSHCRPAAGLRQVSAMGRPGRGHGRAGAGRVLAADAHQPAYGVAGSADGFYIRGYLHAAQARHHAGHFYWRVSGRHGPHARLDRGSSADRVAVRSAVRHPFCMAVSSLHVHRVALPR